MIGIANLSTLAAAIALGVSSQQGQTTSFLKPDFGYTPRWQRPNRRELISLAERNRILNAAAAKRRKNAKRKAAKKARRAAK